MKAVRTIALFLCIIFVSSFICRAKAEDVIGTSALEQCAAELSQSTCYKYYKPENTQRYIDYRLIHPDYTLDAIITYVNIGLDWLFYTNTVGIANPHKTSVLVNKYRPLPANFVPWNLEKITGTYGYGTQKLTHYARLAFERLCADAKKYGYPIWAVSSNRTYGKQAEVYAKTAYLLGAREGRAFLERHPGVGALLVPRVGGPWVVGDIDIVEIHHG
jgi:hypothetical protein